MNVALQRRIDRWVGVPLCRLLSLWPGARRSPSDAPPPRRILVILLSEMGSLVLARPMFARLREKYPEAALYALVFRRNREVLDLLEEVPEENVVTLRNDGLGTLLRDAASAVRRLRAIGVDTAIDCELFSRVSALLAFASGAARRAGFHRHRQEGLYRGDFINRPVLYNPYQHMAHQFVSLAEALEGDGRPLVKRSVSGDALDPGTLRLREGELEAARAGFERDYPEAKGERLVLIYAGGGLLPIRAWPLASFEALARALLAEGFVVGVVGLAEDRPLAAAIRKACASDRVLDLTGYTRTVRALVLLFHLAELLVTNDGGPGHFASLTPIRTILLFGPETPALYGSLDPEAVHFYKGIACSPCLTAYNHRESPCDGDNQCLKRINVEEVRDTALELLRRSVPAGSR